MNEIVEFEGKGYAILCTSYIVYCYLWYNMWNVVKLLVFSICFLFSGFTLKLVSDLVYLEWNFLFDVFFVVWKNECGLFYCLFL